MTPNLTKYVGKAILVSIPALSEDLRCRSYRLIGIELIGLWLEAEDLRGAFLADEHRSHDMVRWSFFVPFTQIACVAIAEPVESPAVRSGEPKSPLGAEPKPDAEGAAASKKTKRK